MVNQVFYYFCTNQIDNRNILDAEGGLEDSVARWAAGSRSLVIPLHPKHLYVHALCEAGSRLLMLCCRWPPVLSAYRSLRYLFY